MVSIINNYKNIHITFSEDSSRHNKFFTYLINGFLSKNPKLVKDFKELDSIIQNHINPYDTIILDFNTNDRINVHLKKSSIYDISMFKVKTYRYLYRNLNTNHILTRNTPHPTISDADDDGDKIPQPREIAYACDLILYINVKKSIVKIIKNRYGNEEDSDLMIYINRLIEMCNRSEKIKSLYDSD